MFFYFTLHADVSHNTFCVVIESFPRLTFVHKSWALACDHERIMEKVFHEPAIFMIFSPFVPYIYGAIDVKLAIALPT